MELVGTLREIYFVMEQLMRYFVHIISCNYLEFLLDEALLNINNFFVVFLSSYFFHCQYSDNRIYSIEIWRHIGILKIAELSSFYVPCPFRKLVIMALGNLLSFLALIFAFSQADYVGYMLFPPTPLVYNAFCSKFPRPKYVSGNKGQTFTSVQKMVKDYKINNYFFCKWIFH